MLKENQDMPKAPKPLSSFPLAPGTLESPNKVIRKPVIRRQLVAYF